MPPSTQVPVSSLRPRPLIGLGANWIGAEEEALTLEVLRSKHLFRYTPRPPEEEGGMVARLERETCEVMGCRYALAVTSGTAALEVALGALGVGPGDEVILAAWTWVSCFTAIVRLGARPVLAEVDDTFCLAPGEITRLKTARTKAVLIVHYQGVAAELSLLIAEAKEAGIRVLEDCAESPGVLYHNQRVGTLGDIGIYSYQYNKTITSGEGGMVVTQDPLLYERAVRMHDLGQLRPHHHDFVTPEVVDFCGGQYRMNEITAAVALAQLRKLDKIRNYCRNLSSRIMARIGCLPGLEFRRIPDPSGDSGFELYFCLPTAEEATAFTTKLAELNINCSRMTGTYCQYERVYCRERATHHPAASPFLEFDQWPAEGYRREDFPKTEGLVHRFVSLPLGVLYTEEDADYIADCVIAVHRELCA